MAIKANDSTTINKNNNNTFIYMYVESSISSKTVDGGRNKEKKNIKIRFCFYLIRNQFYLCGGDNHKNQNGPLNKRTHRKTHKTSIRVEIFSFFFVCLFRLKPLGKSVWKQPIHRKKIDDGIKVLK